MGALTANDPRVFELRAATSLLLERAQLMRQAGLTFNGERDLYTVLGYDRTISDQQYRERYARGGVAKRIVEVFPKATWRGQFEVIENEDPDTETAFETAWETLAARLKIANVLQRADTLAGLSTFAVVLLGAPGDWAEELPKGTPDKLLYLQPYSGGGGPLLSRTMTVSDADCRVETLVTRTDDPRYGLPEYYQLRSTMPDGTAGAPRVHWSRILHLAEGCLTDEVYGQPTLENVWNLLDDLDKVTGGGAEAFWLRANQGLQLDVDKDMEMSEEDKAALAAMAEEYSHQVRRMLRTRGVRAQALGSDTANFSEPADAILTQIAGSKGIPKRILTGSEMGELASTQDRDNWKDQVTGRRINYAEPQIVRPLVDRLIKYGYLPTPKTPYVVRWPEMIVLTEDEKATGAGKWAAVNQSAGTVIFTPDEIRDKWYGMPPLTPEQIAAATPKTDEPEVEPEPKAASATQVEYGLVDGRMRPIRLIKGA